MWRIGGKCRDCSFSVGVFSPDDDADDESNDLDESATLLLSEEDAEETAVAVGKFADAPLPPSPPKPMDAIRLRAALFMSPDSEEEEGGGGWKRTTLL